MPLRWLLLHIDHMVSEDILVNVRLNSKGETHCALLGTDWGFNEFEWSSCKTIISCRLRHFGERGMYPLTVQEKRCSLYSLNRSPNSKKLHDCWGKNGGIFATKI
jgi:hypothetical protein